MALTRPMSLAAITFTCPDGMIFPGAKATISTCPKMDHTRAMTIIAITVQSRNRPTGDGGVSCNSSAAGRNSSSLTLRAMSSLPAAAFISRRLLVEQRGVMPAAGDELAVRALLDDLAPVEHDDAVRGLHRAQPVRDHKHGAALADQPHVVLDDAFGL